MLDTQPCQYPGQWASWQCGKMSSFFAHYKYETWTYSSRLKVLFGQMVGYMVLLHSIRSTVGIIAHTKICPDHDSILINWLCVGHSYLLSGGPPTCESCGTFVENISWSLLLQSSLKALTIILLLILSLKPIFIANCIVHLLQFHVSSVSLILCFITSDFFCLSLKYLGNGWTDMRHIHREDVFGPSLGRVWISRSNVEVTRDKKCAVHSHHPQQWQNGMHSLQITLRRGRWHHSVAREGGVISASLHAAYVW